MEKFIKYYNIMANYLDLEEIEDARGGLDKSIVLIFIVFSMGCPLLHTRVGWGYDEFFFFIFSIIGVFLWITLPAYITYTVLYKLAEKYDYKDKE